MKDQGINANTNNNLNYLIARLHPYFLHYIFIFLFTYEDEILLN